MQVGCGSLDVVILVQSCLSFCVEHSTTVDGLAWIVFKSRAHRDRVNAKVTKDPRLGNMDPKSILVDA